MLSSNLYATVHPIIDDSPAEYLLAEGYTYTVVVSKHGPEAEVVDIVDFKNEFAAQTYAASINLQNGEDNA